MRRPTGRRRAAAGIAVDVVLCLAIALATAWASLAMWYRLPGPDWVKGLGSAFFASVGLGAAILVHRRRLTALLLFGCAFAAVLIWWNMIAVESSADWAPDVARQVTGRRDGNRLVLTNVRDFEWRSDGTALERWDTRIYDLERLRTLDLFLSYWAGPQIAHVILSFGFEGGDQLAWSIEVRRSKDGAFSPVADLFKSNPLVIVAAGERDVVRVRSNVRGEDVQLYRLRTPPEMARALLLEYVDDANALAASPKFYNSLTTNCTTTVVKMARAAGGKLPLDWRLIVNGYLPEYLYGHGALDTDELLPTLTGLSHIADRARAADQSPEFSTLIRIGVPSPRDPPGP